MIRRLSVALGTTATLLCTALAQPAAAETRAFADPASDSRTRGMDIRQVEVSNYPGGLVVTTHHRDLTRRGNSSGTAIWLDTRPRHRGPEFLMAGGASAETDWQIWRARDGRWQTKGDPLACPISMNLRFGADTVQWRTGRECLGDYGKVRVSAESNRARSKRLYSRFDYDYSPARHRWDDWVARG